MASFSQSNKQSAHPFAFLAVGICVSLLLATFCFLLPSIAHASEANAETSDANGAPAISATGAMMEDSEGNVLFDQQGSVSAPMASTTKIMTAVVAIESGISFDTSYTVSELAASNEGTVAGYQQGEVTTLGDMIRVMMAHSAGDAAYGVAECVSGSVDAFVAQMNERAAELGMTGTHYTSPDGYSDANHYSSPADILTLARHAMTLPAFRTIVGSTQVTATVNGQAVTFNNTDYLLDSYPGMLGIKTGFTNGAGYCFVGCATRGGITLYTCILGEQDEDVRMQDTVNLLEWGFSQYPEQTAITAASSRGAETYSVAGYTYGRVLSNSPSSEASLRSSNSSTQITTSLTTDGDLFALPNETQGIVSASQESEDAEVARTISTDSTSHETQSYGPFVSQLFYETED